MRDDFDEKTKQVLARRVGYRCSNPNCRKLTSGPQTDPAKAISIGVAAHITAAASGGPRFDRNLSSTERKSPENGIWLCQNCGKIIDSDDKRFSIALLKEWKKLSEQAALLDVENSSSANEETFIVQEIAQTFTSRLEQHWTYMDYLQQLFIGFLSKPYELSLELKAQTLDFNLKQLKQDEIYQNARLRIGVLPRKVLDFVSPYTLHFSMLLGVLEGVVGNPLSLENSSVLQRFCIQIIYTRIDCALTLAVLNREILCNTERFLQCKVYLQSEYERAREALVSGEELPTVVFSTLEGVEMFFKDLKTIDEISPLIIRPTIN
ncbi:MAG: hypothetical protein LRZ84_08055 [Desertifilum sp.]|nr:hypothetical protein [Desertifilum sp.]